MTDNNISRNTKKEIGRIICSVLAGIVLGGAIGVFAWIKFMPKAESIEPQEKIVVVAKESAPEPKIDRVTFEYVSAKLENIGKLSTAEMMYSAICSVEDGKIPFITKGGFSMVYSAKVRAGIDVNKIDIEVTDETVSVKIPKAEVDVCHVLPDSITFFSSKFALFNWNTKEDVAAAISLAESDLSKSPDIDALLERANENAKAIVESILRDSIDEKTLSVSIG